MTRNYTLHSHVKARDEASKDKRYRELVEEGKIAFDASEMAKLAVDAKKSHSTLVLGIIYIDGVDLFDFPFDMDILHFVIHTHLC